MSANTYCNPRLHIEGVGIYEEIEGTIDFPGYNKISTLQIKLKTNRLAEASLSNKRVTFFINYGGWDTVPMFTGYIKDVNSSDTSMTLKCYDARCYLAGEHAKTIIIDDNDNYDGFTVAGFLKKYIDEFINTDETIIDTNYINDTNPPVTFIDYRTDGATPYEIVVGAMRDASDTSDTFDIFNYEIVLENTMYAPYLKFKKQKRLDDTPSMTLSYGDGIQSYSYKKRRRPNQVQLGNSTIDWNGEKNKVPIQDVRIYAKDVKEKLASPALIAKQALKGLKKLREDKYDIDVKSTKGHYIQVGQLIYLNVEEEIKGNHRLVSKKISFGKAGASLSFKLNCDKLVNSY